MTASCQWDAAMNSSCPIPTYRSIFSMHRECAAGREHPDSQGNGFRKDAISQVGREGSLGHHIHRAVYEILQILLEPHEIEEGAPLFEGHEQVEVAILPPFASGQGAEDAHVPCPMA